MHVRIQKGLEVSAVGLILAVAVTLGASGCSLDRGSADPTLVGPSEFGLSITLTATPDQLPADGTSQSVIVLTARDDRSQPVTGQRLSVSASVGTLSESEVVTASDGRASFAFTSPTNAGCGQSSSAVVTVVPVGTGISSAFGRTVNILLTGTPNLSCPDAEFTFEPSDPVVKGPVVFDASATTDGNVVCGDVCTYAWDFGGEATATGRVVSYAFLTAKTYGVTLTVTDAGGAKDTETKNVEVDQGTAPTATFTFSPSSPGLFQTIHFTGTESTAGQEGRTLDSYSWNFGDGATATGVTASHSYSVLGTFRVTLTVTDSAGFEDSSNQNITLVNGVTADFTFSPTNPDGGEEVAFNAEASRGSDDGFGGRNTITKYIWHFGIDEDLREITSSITGRTFPASSEDRTYTVTLTVEDSAGRRQTTSQTIVVGKI